MENEELLINKYDSKATPAQGIRIELKKRDFVEMLMEME